MLDRLGLSLRRNVATMAARKAPAEPLLVVLGSTGTGKSQLAVELATRFRGEVVNADSMQLYSGLPIITNKLPPPEQRRVPHHLLGHIAPDEPPWDVDRFRREALKVLGEVRRRGSLPIVIGGTNYYIDALLFPDVTLADVHAAPTGPFPILDEPTNVLLRELRRHDPVMADRWHPNDWRKIKRSLEICLHIGRPASQLYAEQEERRVAASRQSWDKLLFWVHSDRDVLKERLDRRVDDMLDAGLLGEAQELFDLKRQRTAEGRAPDMTKGLWQSIGYRQFEPYLSALDAGDAPPALQQLKAKALDDMKTATRRYANYQTRWIRLKQMRCLQELGPAAMQSLYLVDSTDTARFATDVVEPAARLTAQFLAGEPQPPPTALSDRAREVLAVAGDPPPRETPLMRTCELCQAHLMTDEAWGRHVRGAAHRRVAKKRKKLAVVPVEGSLSPPSSPDISSLF